MIAFGGGSTRHPGKMSATLGGFAKISLILLYFQRIDLATEKPSLP
jgi:hypothetical protein